MNAAALVVAVLLAGMGIGALVRPALIWAPFGVEPTTAESRNEIRAVYGGFGLALAALMFLTRDSVELREGVLMTVAVALFGMAAGRVVSGALEPRALAGWPGFFLLAEVAGGGLCLMAR